MIISEAGQLEKHVADNEVDRAIVSQATREMAQGRPDFASENDRDQAIAAARRTLICASDEVRKIQLRLSEINGSIRGKRLPQNVFRSFCEEQAILKKRLVPAMKDEGAAKEAVRILGLGIVRGTDPNARKLSHHELLERIDRNLLLVLARLDRLEK